MKFVQDNDECIIYEEDKTQLFKGTEFANDVLAFKMTDQAITISLLKSSEPIEFEFDFNKLVVLDNVIAKKIKTNCNFKFGDNVKIDTLELDFDVTNLDALIDSVKGKVINLTIFSNQSCMISKSHHFEGNFNLSSNMKITVGDKKLVELYSLGGTIILNGANLDLQWAKIFTKQSLDLRGKKNITIGCHIAETDHVTSNWYGNVSAPFTKFKQNGAFIASNYKLHIESEADIGIFCSEVFCNNDAYIKCNTLTNKAGIVTIIKDFTSDIKTIINTMYDLVTVTLPNTYYTYSDRREGRETSRHSHFYVGGNYTPKQLVNVYNTSSVFNVVGSVLRKDNINYHNKTAQLARGSKHHKDSYKETKYPTAIQGTVVLGSETTIKAKTFYNTGLIVCNDTLSFDIEKDFETRSVSYFSDNIKLTVKPLDESLKDSPLFIKKDGVIDCVVPLVSTIKKEDIGGIIVSNKPFDNPDHLMTPIALEIALIRSLKTTVGSGDTPSRLLEKWTASASEFIERVGLNNQVLAIDDKPYQLIKKDMSIIIKPADIKETMLFWKVEKNALVPYIVEKTNTKTGTIIAKALNIKSGESVLVDGGTVAGKDYINIKSHDVTITSQVSERGVTRIIDGKSFGGTEKVIDSVGQAVSMGTIGVDATNIRLVGAQTVSGMGTALCASEHLIDIPIIESTSLETKYKHKGAKLTDHIDETRSVGSSHVSLTKVIVVSGKEMMLKQPSFKTDELGLISQKEIIMADGYHTHHRTIEGKTSSMSIKDTVINNTQYSANPEALCINSNTTTILSPAITMTNPKIEKGTVKIEAGVASILPSYNINQSSMQKIQDGTINRTTTMEIDLKKIYLEPQIHAELDIEATKLFIGTIDGKKPEFIKNLKSTNALVYSDFNNTHISKYIKDTGFSKGTIILVAITCGVAGGIGGSMIASSAGMGAVTTSMTTMACASLASKAGTGLMVTKGDLSKTGKMLTDKDYLKRLSASIVTAGLSSAILHTMETTSIIDHFRNSLVHNGIGIVSSIIIADEDKKEAFINGLKSIVACTFAGSAKEQFKGKYNAAEIDYVSYKISTTFINIASGCIISNLSWNVLIDQTIKSTITSIVESKYDDEISEQSFNKDKLLSLIREKEFISNIVSLIPLWAMKRDFENVKN